MRLTPWSRTSGVYVAFEIGPTITGLQSALDLIDAAALARADAIKWQMLDADRLVGDPALAVSWGGADGQTHTAPMRKVLTRRELSPADWEYCAYRAHEAGLEIIATVDFPETLAVAKQIGVDAVKACSGDVTHLDWIAELARAGLPLMLDTGHATLGEIERAVDVAREAGNDRLVIHHCPSGYPARLESINLRVISTLRQMFPDCCIAFSDHSPGRDMDVAAVALGVDMIEKTLTLDRTQDGPEHMFSLEPDEAAGFVQAIRDVETAMGSSRRVLTDAERRAKVAARRSAWAARDIPQGECVYPSTGAVAWRRPGDGIEPDQMPWGRQAACNLRAGDQLHTEDFT